MTPYYGRTLYGFIRVNSVPYNGRSKPSTVRVRRRIYGDVNTGYTDTVPSPTKAEGTAVDGIWQRAAVMTSLGHNHAPHRLARLPSKATQRTRFLPSTLPPA
ncbi:hypothetical protein M422DRAFT_269474 [Sphaerobolus stellatus SS14]|uniref:Uncharacterized protein n=1 Tax=Sphaerobolus stellatus (strain SS14) TaxID=990650 RepID=A0A0C9UJR9_SPHS4|nr:hypothetical protein M422DRAFT_269474 [Sphaerobolus stellatus SS14]